MTDDKLAPARGAMVAIGLVLVWAAAIWWWFS